MDEARRGSAQDRSRERRPDAEALQDLQRIEDFLVELALHMATSSSRARRGRHSKQMRILESNPYTCSMAHDNPL